MQEKMSNLVDNKTKQEELVLNGEKNLKNHSWEKVAERILEKILF